MIVKQDEGDKTTQMHIIDKFQIKNEIQKDKITKGLDYAIANESVYGDNASNVNSQMNDELMEEDDEYNDARNSAHDVVKQSWANHGVSAGNTAAHGGGTGTGGGGGGGGAGGEKYHKKRKKKKGGTKTGGGGGTTTGGEHANS